MPLQNLNTTMLTVEMCIDSLIYQPSNHMSTVWTQVINTATNKILNYKATKPPNHPKVWIDNFNSHCLRTFPRSASKSKNLSQEIWVEKEKLDLSKCQWIGSIWHVFFNKDVICINLVCLKFFSVRYSANLKHIQ